MSTVLQRRTFDVSAQLPEELTSVPRWICWQYQAKGIGKPTKVPVDPVKLRPLKEWQKDPGCWLEFEDAVALYEANPALAGIGFVLTADLGIIGLDLDDAINMETGEVAEWAAEHVRDFDTYTEVSPSGAGLRMFTLGTLPGDVPHNVKPREIYSAGRWLTVTGRVWNDSPVVANDGAVARYIDAMRREKAERPAASGSSGAASSNAELVAAIIRGDELHDSTRNYAFRLVEDGMAPGKVVETLRGVMLNSDARVSDPGRWQERYDDIPRLVRDAEGKSRKIADAQVTGTLAAAIHSLLTPVSDAELEDAKSMHPHAFMRGEMGAFPLGELTIVGAPGRAGKTTALVGILTRYALGADLAGMRPQAPRRAVILSAEDDRKQYVRKLGAQMEGLTAAEKARIRERIIIPDLNAPAVRDYRQLVAMIDRHPRKTPTVAALVEALAPMVADPIPLGLVVLETASTWNDAGEDNPGQRAMAAAGKDIAQALGVAVVLVHHTSQAASNNLPTLDISSYDIRGGTALTFDSRQNWLLVDLGSDAKPLRERDARTVLRRAIAPGNPHRIAVLICLDSSKSENPPPVFLQWEKSRDYGPRVVEIEPPAEYAGKQWELVRSQLLAERAEARQEAKDAERYANIRTCIEAVARLEEEGKQPTVRAVSIKACRSPGWAAPYLSAAVDDGSLRLVKEAVPRTRGLSDVYRLADSSLIDGSREDAA